MVIIAVLLMKHKKKERNDMLPPGPGPYVVYTPEG